MKAPHSARLVRRSCQILGVLTLPLFALAASALAQERAPDLYQQALRMERVSGDLEGAIGLYQQVVETGDRPLGARALIRIAETYEKLGRQGAQDAYARVISEFSDQTEQVALARERLAALERPIAERTTEPRGITTRRLLTWVYGEASPLAITPDGKELVYSDLWFGNLDVRDLTNGQTRDLTQEKSWSDWGARVSPDGRTVSYLTRPPTSSIRLVRIDGSGSRILYQEPGCSAGQHEWTSDGEHIIAPLRCGEEGQRLARVSVADGDVEVVAEIGHVGRLFLSSEDRFLAYELAAEDDGDNLDIWILALDGSLNIPLVRHPANDRLLGWLPGTDEVLFLSDRSGTTDLWTVRLEAGSVVGLPRLVRRNTGDLDPLGLTDDGALVYSNFTRWFSTGVAPVDLAAGTIDLESRVETFGSNLPATWSPDGEYLAFVQEQEGAGPLGGPYNRPLRIRHLATGEERELASHLQTRNQKWSPDGNSILFCGWDPVEEPEPYGGGLYLVDVESGQTEQVLALDPESKAWFWSDLGAEWYRDGSAIIYARYDNNLREGYLVWRDLVSGEERELFRDPRLTTRMLALSPGGNRLAFGLRTTPTGYSSSIHSGGRLLVMDLDDGEVEELHEIPEEGRVWSLQWTPDGEHLLYTKRTDDHKTAVWKVPVAVGEAEKLWTFEEDHYDAYISLRPDGRQVAYTTYHQEVEVWVMENLLSVLGGGGR